MRTVGGSTARPLAWLLVSALLLLVRLHPARGGDERDLGALDHDAIARILCTEPVSEDLTRALLARGQLRLAVSEALHDATPEQILDVADHVAALGLVTGGVGRRRFWDPLRHVLDVDVCFEGVVRRITHPGLHAWFVEVDVREVFAGSLALTPDDTPLVVGVRASGGGTELRWIGNTWEAGTRLTFCASHGEVLVECPARLVRCLRSWGDFVWETTGRERETLRRLAPLTCRDPHRLLEGMRSDDLQRRYLYTAKTLLACRDLGPPFADGLERCRTKETILSIREALAARLAGIADTLVWDAREGRFTTGGDAPGGEE